MPRFPNDGKFVYFNLHTPDRPVNPAISKILGKSRNREFFHSFAVFGEYLFKARAERDKRGRFNPTSNSKMVRTRTGKVRPIDIEGKEYWKKDRWGSFVEAYAPHALAREFGWDHQQIDSGKNISAKASEKTRNRRRQANRENTGEHNLRGVAIELDRLFHRPK